MILTIYVEIDETVNSSIADKTRDILSTLWLVERVKAISPSETSLFKSLDELKKRCESIGYIVLDNFDRSGVKSVKV